MRECFMAFPRLPSGLQFAVKMEYPYLYVRLLDSHARPLPLVPNRGTLLLAGYLSIIYQIRVGCDHLHRRPRITCDLRLADRKRWRSKADGRRGWIYASGFDIIWFRWGLLSPNSPAFPDS